MREERRLTLLQELVACSVFCVALYLVTSGFIETGIKKGGGDDPFV